MAKKKTKVQKDLFGNNIEDDKAQQTIDSIARKIEPEKEFDYREWLEKVRAYQDQGDKEKELECYNILEKGEDLLWDMGSDDFLRKGTLLVDFGKYDEAFKILDNLYGCESQDTIVAPAQLQLARISAIQDKEDNMLHYLKEAFRTTVFFDPYYNLRTNIEQIKELDKYRDTKEFQQIINYHWEQEDEFEVENKIREYLRKKKINPEHLDPIRLRFLEFLCRYSESDISLDFNIEEMWLVNSTKSIMIIKNYMIKPLDKGEGIVPQAQLHFSHNCLESVKSIYLDQTNYRFDKPTVKEILSYEIPRIRTYTKEKIEIVQKIIEGPFDVHIYENFLMFAPLHYLGSGYHRSYRDYELGRLDTNYYVILFPQPLDNVAAFVEPRGTQDLFKLVNFIFKNYPMNPVEESKKEKFDPGKYPDSDPLEVSIKALGNKMKQEVNEIEDNSAKLDLMMEYIQIYFQHLTISESVTFSIFVNDLIEDMFRRSSIEEIKRIISFPENKSINTILNKTLYKTMYNHNFTLRTNYFELVKEKIEQCNDDDTRFEILLYFYNHRARHNKHLQKLLKQEIKTQVIKGEVNTIRILLGRFLTMIPKSEREEIFNQIYLNHLQEHLPDEIERMNQYGSSCHNSLCYKHKESMLLLQLLFAFSKFNVQSAQDLLNQELIANFPKFKVKTLDFLTKNKYFSYMDPTKINVICDKFDFAELLKEVSFAKVVYLLERLYKMGYKNAPEIIKFKALNLTLNNKINTKLKSFKKYVTDEELAEFIKSHK